jgi:uncharacterized protein
MGVAYLLLLFCILTAPLSIVAQNKGLDETLLAWIVIVLGGIFTIKSLWNALSGERVIECEIQLGKVLPEELERLKFVVISDVHVSGLIGHRRTRALAAKVNKLKPDVIFAVGDFVDGSVNQLRNEIAPLKELQATYGVYYVTGNHEYYCNPNKWRQHFAQEFCWHVLENTCQQIQIGKHKINILGIEDRSWLRSVGKRKRFDSRLQTAVTAVTSQAELNILVAHQPKDAPQMLKYPWIDVQISGHTHGGQVWPLHVFVYRDQKYNKGIYNIQGSTSGQKIYVSQGAGYWGPPVRLGTSCEISLLTFKGK